MVVSRTGAGRRQRGSGQPPRVPVGGQPGERPTRLDRIGGRLAGASAGRSEPATAPPIAALAPAGAAARPVSRSTAPRRHRRPRAPLKAGLASADGSSRRPAGAPAGPLPLPDTPSRSQPYQLARPPQPKPKPTSICQATGAPSWV